MKTFGFRPLEADYLKLLRLSLLVFMAVLLLLIVVGHLLLEFSMELLLGLIAFWLLLFVCSWWYNRSWYQRYSYSLQASEMLIARGVFWRQLIGIPHNRVQHVDVINGPLERKFKLSKLIIHTAGTRDASVVLHGLSIDQANQLRAELSKTVSDNDAV